MKNSYNPFNYFYIEVWAKHPIYTNYEASNFGNIRSLNYNHTGLPKNLKQSLGGNNYHKVELCQDGKHKMYSSHRFVWECWNGLIPNGYCIDHMDTNTSNNRLTNLRLCKTQKENINNQLTLTKKVNNLKKSKIVEQYSLEGDFIKEFPSASEVQRILGFPQSNISATCRGKFKKAYGYKWKYKEDKVAL